MNAVAFCLYGSDPKYYEGMIRNAWLMPRIYPGWECHVWIADDVPLQIILRLRSLTDITLHPMDQGYAQRMFYRFLIHDVPGVDRYLIRDADSRISMRERLCVDEWIASGKILHTIHDHPYHIRPIQGGMFGIWRTQMNWPGALTMKSQIASWANENRWGKDEEFLEAVVWPLCCTSFMEHGRLNPIPETDEDPEAFIGEQMTAADQPLMAGHRTMRKAKR